jgi:DNA-directed RNA polymerase specialized sigma24 family protein
MGRPGQDLRRLRTADTPGLAAPAELSSRDLGPAPPPRLPSMSRCWSRGWPTSGQADLAWSRGSADTRLAEERVLGSAVRAEIIAAIWALPASYRLTVYLADVKGLSYQQITT